jgi:protein-arginine kinase activator protein McsA
MSLKESLEEVKELAHMVMEDRKEEKTQAQREKNTVQLVCPYCGTSSRFVWEDGKLPTCPNCGATFDAEDPQIKKLREEKSQEADVQRRAQETAALESVKTRSKIRRYVIIGIVVVVALAAVVVAAKLYGGNLHLSGGGTFDFHIS